MKNQKTGIIYMILSVLFFAVVNTLVKYLGTHVSSWTKALYRSLFGLISLLFWIIVKRKRISLKGIPLLIVRGIMGGIALGCSFWTIELKGLSVSIFYLHTYPIFAPLFSSILFKEKFDPFYLFPLVLALTGIYILTDPLQSSISLGDITGIISGLAAGLAIATLRELRKANESEVIYLSFLVFSIPVTALGILFIPEQSIHITQHITGNTFTIWSILIIIGISATVAQLFMTEAYQSLSTQRGSLISLIQIPIVAAIAIVFFKESMTWSLLAGGILIGFACILTILQKQKKQI